MNFLNYITARPVAVSMIYMIVFGLGIISLFRLPLELMPGVEFPQLTVQTSWPNTSPETVEAFITAPIEAACHTLNDVRSVSSSSQEGQSIVTVECGDKVDMDFAALELNEKLSLVREDLPYGASAPRIIKYVPKEFATGNFMTFHLSGEMPLSDLRHFAMSRVRGLLLSMDGIADVEVIGGVESVIQIEMDPAKCEVFNIHPVMISQAINQAAQQQNLGFMQTNNDRKVVRLDNRLISIRDIENIILQSDEQRHLQIRDVARVGVTHTSPHRLKRINAKPAVVLNIHKIPGANSIHTANKILLQVKKLQRQLPAGVELLKVHDQSDIIRHDLRDLGSRAAFSVVVVFLVLLFFLRRLVSPLIILSTIFFAVLMTVIFFYITHMTLNILTLAGLALGFGMLVDNSIVVLDNIFRHYERTNSAQLASLQGTTEIFLPVLASTLTTLAALGPFLYMTGEIRAYYIPFALSVSLSLLSSLVVAFTFTPALTTKILLLQKKSTAENNSFFFNTVYGKLLRCCLSHKILFSSMLFLLLISTGYLFDKFVYRGPIWRMPEQSYIDVQLSLPKGIDLEAVDTIARQFEAEAMADGLIERVTCDIYDEFAWLHITFPDSIEHSGYPLLLKEKLIVKAASMGGATVGVYGFGKGFSTGVNSVMPSLSIKVLGYNYNRVKNVAEALGTRLSQYPAVRNVNTNTTDWWLRDDTFETALCLNREHVQQHRITPFLAFSQIQHYLRENISRQRIVLHGLDYELQIKMQGADQFDIETLEQLIVSNALGEPVRLIDIAEIAQFPLLPRIDRENQQYQQIVSFDYHGAYKYGQELVDLIIKTTQLPPGFRLESSKMWSWMAKEEKEQIYLVILFSLILVFIVTAALYESIRLPFIVLFSVPMGLIGVFLIYLITGRAFDRGAYIGLVLLGGIVVNNAILLVSSIQQIYHSGLPLEKAVVQASTQRLRPILMTSLTTILGLFPLILNTRDDSLWSSLALSTVGGLTSSTLFIIFIIPILYIFMAKKI